MTVFFYEHFFGKFEDTVDELRKPMLALSNLLSNDFIFFLFPELDVFIHSGLNVPVDLCVSMPNKMRNKAQEKN